MKKDKKSHRSKILERRRHRTPEQSHHKRSSESREKHTKHHRPSKSPSSLKRKHEEEKDEGTSKTEYEVGHSTAKTDPHAGESESHVIVFENVLNDKGKLIQELFEAVAEDNLKKLTPDSLKNCPLDELRIMCLEELNRMSNAEIVHILSGKDPASFDPSLINEETKEQDTLNSLVTESNEQCKEDTQEKTTDTCSLHREPPKQLTSNRVSVEDEQESTSSVIGDTKSEAESDSLELCATQKEVDSLIQEEILNQTGAQGLAQQSKSDLTDMEILELELRARIIRSLLKNHGMEVSDEEEKIQQKENVKIGERNT